MKNKILHIIYSGLGGTTDYVFNLIKGDKEKIFDHSIVFFGVEECPENVIGEAEQIAGSVDRIHKKPGLDKVANGKLRNVIHREDPMAITLHVNSLIYPLSKIIPKTIKLIFVEHQANHLKNRKEFVWSILAQKRADHIVCLTGEYQSELKKKLKFLFKPKKNKVIRTGLDLNEFSKERDYSRMKKIGMLSRINAFRDHETLCRAFLDLDPDDMELHIAGEGPLLDELKTKFPDERIHFRGMLSKIESVRFLEEIDIYVHATLGETSSLSLMQAQVSGLPIIASDVKGVSNNMEDGTAILVPPKNVGELKIKLQAMVNDKASRKKMGHRAKQYALENLDCQKMFNAYKKLME